MPWYLRWLELPRDLAHFIAFKMLGLPDEWRPYAAKVMTFVLWIDIALFIVLAALQTYINMT